MAREGVEDALGWDSLPVWTVKQAMLHSLQAHVHNYLSLRTCFLAEFIKERLSRVSMIFEWQL